MQSTVNIDGSTDGSIGINTDLNTNLSAALEKSEFELKTIILQRKGISHDI
jgi:hypothetical protein